MGCVEQPICLAILRAESTPNPSLRIISKAVSIEEEGNPIEIVVHVNMLGEGWDVRNLYTIIPLRAAKAHTLIEQTIGRGLRLPFAGERTGVDHIDKLTIIAHDDFQKIVDAAKEEGSILHRCSYVELDAEELDTEPVNIVTIEPKTNEPLAYYQAQVASAQTSQERKKAQTLYDATQAVQAVLSDVALETQSASIEEIAKNEEKLALLTSRAKEAVAKTNSLFAPLVQEELSASFVKETIMRFKRNLIEIPRISILPQEVRYELERFKVDFTQGQFDFIERKERIVRQDLVDSKQELLEVVESGRLKNIKSKLLIQLLNEPEIDYSEMREELVDALNQVLEYVRHYSSDDEVASRTIDQNSQLIASRLYEQIQKHFIKEVVSYREAKVLPFVKIEPVHLGERAGYPRKTLYEKIPSLHQIRRFIFHGFAKACHECYSFDSGTERNFAQVLEQDDEVLVWLRPAAMQFNINWGRDSRRYEPDFVVETTDAIYLVETKARKELSNEEVLAKAEAARQYCLLATGYTTKYGGKPWEYFLVSHLDIEPTFSFQYVRELSKGN